MLQPVLMALLVMLVLSGCTKLLDKQPITQIVRKTDSNII